MFDSSYAKGLKTMLITVVIFCLAVGFFLGWILT